MFFSANISKQKGQSLLWVMGFLATMAVAFAGVYSVGQTTSEKQKIVNAVDAAAYTGAMVEARALNLTAYANRAEIANEVLIAQVISLQSWVDYLKTSISSFQTIAEVLGKIPFPPTVIALNAIARALSVIEKALEKAADPGLTGLAPATIFAVERYYDLMNGALKVVFGTVGTASMAYAAQTAAENVLAANVATHNGKIDTAPVAIHKIELAVLNAKAWNSSFQYYKKNQPAGSADDGRYNASEILKISRDEFSTDRKGPNGLLAILWGTASIGGCSIPGVEVGANREGSTLLKTYDRWEAQDTSEYYIASGFRCNKTGIPYGWGRSTAAKEKMKGDEKTDINQTAGSELFAYKDGNVKKNSGWTGVKELWDVKRDANDYPDAAFNPGAETLTFAIAAAKPKANIRNNESLNFMNQSTTSPLGSADAKADYQNGQIAAKAEAKVFFARPAKNSQDFTGTSLFRNDNHKEIANLYNPYWQVRLTNTSTLTNIATSKLLALFVQ